ncbi:MAG TPA: transporter substrate-binding domain-containing protein [Xanthobacteraceae bacterium]|jgi:polar amino acid transport system substrate-binding protein|nr:transporter substrate-binding domain-containing protein [Xanthobacteraceae bacterium]
MIRFLRIALLFVFPVLGALPAPGNDLVPTGTLRATFLAGNPVQAVTDPNTGAINGPAADLGAELAQRLNVPLKMIGVPTVQAVLDSIKSGSADIGFIAFDPVRAVEVNFSQPYLLAHNSYVVLNGSPIQTTADIDRAGIRIGVTERDAADFFLTRALKNAQIKRVPPGSIELVTKMLVSGDIDAYATNRHRLTQLVERSAGVRLLPDNFYGVQQSIVVAKGSAALLHHVDQIIDDARKSGLIQKAIVGARLQGVDVAPPRN